MRRGGTLVIQPFPGIGDMIWYLPHLRAIAREEGPITLLTKPRSLARDWLSPDPAIREVLYADRRLLSLVIPGLLRRHFQKAWILHRSLSYAVLPFLAGIPERVGFGYHSQKHFLTCAETLPENLSSRHTIVQLNAMMKRVGYNLKTEDQIPALCLSAQQSFKQKFSAFPRSWICLGIGGSEDFKRWPLSHFAVLGAEIAHHKKGTLFICGSASEEAEALKLQAMLAQRGAHSEIVTRLSILEAFVLMKECDFYVGNDTSLLNIAGSLGTPAIGLFGATEPLTYVSTIHSVSCPEPALKGKEAMAAISPDVVFHYLEQNHYV